MAKIGYARVSSKEQHLDRQLAALSEEERANLRFLKATEGTPVTEFKDAKEVADWLNDPDED